MRPRADSDAPTLRSQATPTKGKFGIGSSKPAPAPVAAPASKAAPARRFKSRFNDSDDEDDGPTTFRSRFADSDDEDDGPSDLTPVRGIPRRAGDDDDSTDLEEEGDDEGFSGRATQQPPVPTAQDIAKAMWNGQKVPGMAQGQGQGSALASGSMRSEMNEADQAKHAPGEKADVMLGRSSTEKRGKRGFFGMGRKKGDDGEAPIQEEQPASSSVVRVSTAEHERPMSPMGTPTRPGKLQKRTSSARPNPNPPPTLNQRPNSRRILSDSWPLPPPIPPSATENAPVRPVSSDGVNMPKTMRGKGAPAPPNAPRPALGKRNSTMETSYTSNTAAPDGAAGGKAGKKKKFSMLRRAFGLKD